MRDAVKGVMNCCNLLHAPNVLQRDAMGVILSLALQLNTRLSARMWVRGHIREPLRRLQGSLRLRLRRSLSFHIIARGLSSDSENYVWASSQQLIGSVVDWQDFQEF